MIGPCAALSLVGRNIRGILHALGDALRLFEQERIYLVSQAANDLNFTFVIDEAQGDRLVAALHDLLIQVAVNDRVLGPTWSELQGPEVHSDALVPCGACGGSSCSPHWALGTPLTSMTCRQ